MMAMILAALSTIWASTKVVAPKIFGDILVATRKTMAFLRKRWRKAKPYLIDALRWLTATLIYVVVYIWAFTKYMTIHGLKLLCRKIEKYALISWNYVSTPVKGYIFGQVAKVRNWFGRWRMVIHY